MTIKIKLPMPISINQAYGNIPGRGRYKTTKYKDWEKACGETEQEEHEFEYNGKVLDISYKFYSKWFNLDGSVKRKDVSNFIKVLEDYIPNIIKGFDDKYISVFTATKVHSSREEVEFEIKEINIPYKNYETKSS